MKGPDGARAGPHGPEESSEWVPFFSNLRQQREGDAHGNTTGNAHGDTHGGTHGGSTSPRQPALSLADSIAWHTPATPPIRIVDAAIQPISSLETTVQPIKTLNAYDAGRRQADGTPVHAPPLVSAEFPASKGGYGLWYSPTFRP